MGGITIDGKMDGNIDEIYHKIKVARPEQSRAHATATITWPPLTSPSV